MGYRRKYQRPKTTDADTKLRSVKYYINFSKQPFKCYKFCLYYQSVLYIYLSISSFGVCSFWVSWYIHASTQSSWWRNTKM